MTAEPPAAEDPTLAPPAALPPWFEAFITAFTSGVAHGFLICGDVSGFTVQSIPQRRFLQRMLASGKRDVVAYYNRATGITFILESMRQKAEQLLGGSAAASAPENPIAAALASSNLGVQPSGDVFRSARSPTAALSLLERLLRAPRGAGRVAVIIDYLDLLCPPTDKGAMSPDDRLALATLLSWGQDEDLSDQNNPIFLIARSVGEIHPDLRSSGSGYRLLEIPLPTREERLEYLQWYLKRRAKDQKTIRLLDLSEVELANLTAGLNLRNLEDVLLLGARKGVSRALVKERKDGIIAAEYSDVAAMLDPLAGGFSSLGGMDKLKGWARRSIIARLAQGRRDVPKNVLLVGPPGTGKTMFVQALGAEIGFNSVMLKAENILGGIVGESERKLKTFLDFVRSLAPVLVFFDELDQSDMARRGTFSGNPVASNLFSQLLQFMSNELLRGQVLMFFASNRPDLIDPAMLRLGRMDAIIPVLLPDEAARGGIITAQAALQEVTMAREVVAELAARTRDYSAADLAALVFKARDLAGREERRSVLIADVTAALGFIRPNTPQTAERYTLKAIQVCNDAELLPPPYDELLANREQLEARLAELSPLDQLAAPSRRGERSW